MIWYKLFLSTAWTFIKPFVIFLLTQAGAALASAAVDAVRWVNENRNDLSNDEKRKEAFRVITNQLKGQGITIATSTINAAIEAAVVKLKLEAK